MKRPKHYRLDPIGYIHKTEAQSSIELLPAYREGLLGIEGFSHIIVCYWLHGNDTKKGRSVLQVHPRGDTANPLTGVFATHSPVRPNPLALSLCAIERVEGTSLVITEIDAFDGSPVIDIKCYIPYDRREVRVPDWV